MNVRVKQRAARTFVPPDGTFSGAPRLGKGRCKRHFTGDTLMNSIIYLVGLVVVVLAILSFIGLR